MAHITGKARETAAAKICPDKINISSVRIITAKLRNCSQVARCTLREPLYAYSVSMLIVDKSKISRKFFADLFFELGMTVDAVEKTAGTMRILRNYLRSLFLMPRLIILDKIYLYIALCNATCLL